MDIEKKYKKSIETLNQVGIALSSEDDRQLLLQKILTGAMTLTHADGGTLYLADKDKLSFAMIANKTLNISPSLTIDKKMPLKSVPLFTNDKPNMSNVASYCFHKQQTINIKDAYQTDEFDFSGMRAVDEKMGYQSHSFLTIPLKNHEKKILGILQLINAVDEETHEIIPFDEESAILAESLASQAAVTLTKFELIKAQKKLFDALLHLIAHAIDEKSHHTSNHCSRVPIITKLIADALNKDNIAHHKVPLTKNEIEELMIAAWLHDCGKIATPDHIVNKATKLDTVMDRIEVVNARFEILKRDLKIDYLEKRINSNELAEKLKFLNEANAFLNKANIGGEFLSENEIKKIHDIGKDFKYLINDLECNLLDDKEIANLCIPRGTLNDSERQIIQNHVKISYDMLRALPYPENLKRVPDIAGAHHERIDGKGYPHGKKGEEILIQARILAIADIFEALTSPDRPYKTPKTLKEVLFLMENMKKAGHIDADLFDLFVKDKIYLQFGKAFLSEKQLDIT